MFGISGTELAIILIFGFLIFGPDRLPAMGRTIGRALRQFQQAQDQMNKMVQTEIYDPINEAAKEPVKKQGPKKKTTSGSSSTKPETFAEKKARLAAEAQAKAARAAGASATGEQEAVAVPDAPVGRSETFAEKKARLEAEKAAEQAKKDRKTTPAAPVAGNAGARQVRTASPTRNKNLSNHSFKLYDLDSANDAKASAAATPDKGKGDQAEA